MTAGDESHVVWRHEAARSEPRPEGLREALARAFSQGYRAGLANEVDDWNASDEAVAEYGRQYAGRADTAALAATPPAEPSRLDDLPFIVLPDGGGDHWAYVKREDVRSLLAATPPAEGLREALEQLLYETDGSADHFLDVAHRYGISIAFAALTPEQPE